MTQTDTPAYANASAEQNQEAPVQAGMHQFTATMISPEAEAYSRQATIDHHLANVRIAEQQFRAVTANLLTYLSSDHQGEKPDVIVTKKGCQSAFGPIEHVGLAYRVGWENGLDPLPLPDRAPYHHFTHDQVTSVTEANGYITLHIS